MKTLSIIICAVLLCSFQSQKMNAPGTDSKTMLKTDLFEYLEETKENLEESVKGLSEEQMTFKAAPDQWSVAECVEHIITVENALNSMLQEKLSGPEDEDAQSQVSMSDDQILAFINDRSSKVKTSPEFEPNDKYSNSDEALEAFNDQREDIVDALKDSDANMRNYILDMPFGKLDAYQVVLFMAGHTARHTQQIEEVKSNPDFPED